MKFNCKKITIDDEEHGCTVSFSDKKTEGYYSDKMSIAEIVASLGQYLTLQRTYTEGDFEEDYYYIEISNSDKCGELKKIMIDLYRNRFLLTYDNEVFEIKISIGDHKFERLKNALKKSANKDGQLKIYGD